MYRGGKTSDCWGRPKCTECTHLIEGKRGAWNPAGGPRSTSFPCTSTLNGRNSLDCRAGDPVLPWGRGAEEDVQQAIDECQVSTYNQAPSERCVHVWILLQVNTSVCIRDDQEVETIGHKTCWRAPSLLRFGFSSFYAMQSLLFTFLLSAPRLSVLNDAGFVHHCVYLSLSSVLCCQLQGAITFAMVDFKLPVWYHSPWICREMPLACELPGPMRLCPAITGVSFKYRSLVLTSG